MIYRVVFSDGTQCHTGYKPLALVWAKRAGSKLTEVDMSQKQILMVTAGGDMELRPLYATTPEEMQLDAMKSSVAVAWGWLHHVTTDDARVKTARKELVKWLTKEMKRYGIDKAKSEGAQINIEEIESAMLRSGLFDD